MSKLHTWEDTIIIIDAVKTDSATFAHEIVHALGVNYDLENEKDKDNLMYHAQKNWKDAKNDLDSFQLDIIFMNVYSYLEMGKKENETETRKTVE